MRLWRIYVRLGMQDLRLRFRRSFFGVSWIFINLAVTIALVGVVFGTLFEQELSHFLPFLTAGLVIWGFFNSALSEGGNAFLNAEGYIKQIGLPIYIYIFRSVVSITLTLLISLLVYVIVAAVFRVPFGFGMLWAFAGLLFLVLYALFFSLIFAFLIPRYRELNHILYAGMQILFYITPIIYPPEILRARGFNIIFDINPFYHFIEVMRHPLLKAEMASAESYLFSALFLLAMALAAILVAIKMRRRLVYYL
ncbi:MAG: ABC transporter permease [Myxococcota bacterium]